MAFLLLVSRIGKKTKQNQKNKAPNLSYRIERNGNGTMVHHNARSSPIYYLKLVIVHSSNHS